MTTPSSPAVAEDRTGEPSPAPSDCPVCPHPRADHDAIGTRYCAAKIAGGSARGCVCRAAPPRTR